MVPSMTAAIAVTAATMEARALVDNGGIMVPVAASAWSERCSTVWQLVCLYYLAVVRLDHSVGPWRRGPEGAG